MSALARWLWEGRAPAARLVGAVLSPVALAIRGVAAARASAYAAGLLPRTPLGRPTVSIGNLAVGGAGKTPFASWVSAFYVGLGNRPAILLRGYGADEAEVHQRAVPEAIVIAHPDRVAGARAAVERGADLIVLDDAFQRLDVVRDLDIVLVAAESLAASRRTFPAGPWRESWPALARADVVVVTHKRLGRRQAKEAAGPLRRWLRPGSPVALAHLRIARLHGLWSDSLVDTAALARMRVLACAGIADPQAFAAQLRALGAHVKLESRPDHHPFGDREVECLAREGRSWDRLIMTEKDAAKLRARWPRTEPEPLVAALEVTCEPADRDAIEGVLSVVAGRPAGAGARAGASTGTISGGGSRWEL